jgi:P27 family predicted phage terminase small subunit
MAGVKGMATGGTNKLPSEIKHVRGTERASRVNHDEPVVTPGIPKPPDTFTRSQREAYASIVESLKLVNVTTLADGHVIAIAAIALDELNRLDDELKDLDSYMIDVSTVQVRETKRVKTTTRRAAYTVHPLLKAHSDAWQKFRTILREFGLTPQSRSGVKVIAKDGDGGNEFFN